MRSFLLALGTLCRAPKLKNTKPSEASGERRHLFEKAEKLFESFSEYFNLPPSQKIPHRYSQVYLSDHLVYQNYPN